MMNDPHESSRPPSDQGVGPDATPDDSPKSPDEIAWEVMLTEAVGGSGPRDFTADIMSRLARDDLASVQVVRPVSRSRSKRASRRQPGVWVIAAAGLAIVSLVAIGLSLRPTSPSTEALAKGAGGDSSHRTSMEPSGVDPIITPERSTLAKQDAPPSDVMDVAEPIRLDPRSLMPAMDRDLAGTVPQEADRSIPIEKAVASGMADRTPTDVQTHPSRHAVPLTLAAAEVAESFDQYWSAMQTTPTPAVDASQWRDRVANRIGVEVPAEISNVESLESWLRTEPTAASAVADRLVGVLLPAVGKDDPNAEAFEASRSSMRDAIVAGKPMDELIANWLADDDHPIRRGGGSGAAVRVGQLALGMDLRCTGCHADRIDGRLDPSDHWSLAAVLAPKGRETFFETADGRQQFVPRTLTSKFPEEFADVESAQQLAERLIGSKALAGGLVDTVWRMVLRRPIRPSVIDFDVVADDESLRRVREQLVVDLQASDFDLVRTLALVLDSPAMHRQVPALFATDDLPTGGLGDAQRQIETYAAAAPAERSGNLGQRIAFALRQMGGSLDRDRPTMLAQMDQPDEGKPSAAPELKRGMFWDFPDSTTRLSTQWLLSIQDEAQQSSHLAFLAGRPTLPQSVREFDDWMREENIDPELRLQRLWWLIRR